MNVPFSGQTTTCAPFSSAIPCPSKNSSTNGHSWTRRGMLCHGPRKERNMLNHWEWSVPTKPPAEQQERFWDWSEGCQWHIHCPGIWGIYKLLSPTHVSLDEPKKHADFQEFLQTGAPFPPGDVPASFSTWNLHTDLIYKNADVKK